MIKVGSRPQGDRALLHPNPTASKIGTAEIEPCLTTFFQRRIFRDSDFQPFFLAPLAKSKSHT